MRTYHFLGSVLLGGCALAAAAPPAQAPLPLTDSLLRILANPNIAYLLFVLGLLGLVGELITAGTVVPGTVGTISLVLGLIGLGQLPTNWGGAVLIVLAIALFALDIHVPGHALSVGGIAAFALGSLLLFTPFWAPLPDGTVRLNPWIGLWTTAGVGLFFGFGVAAALRARHAPLAVGRETLVGKIGTVRQSLRPAGIVHVEGEEWSAVAVCGGEVPEGTAVRVIGADGLTVRVEPIPPVDLVL